MTFSKWPKVSEPQFPTHESERIGGTEWDSGAVRGKPWEDAQ